MQNDTIIKLQEQIQLEDAKVELFKKALGVQLLGQTQIIQQVTLALLCNGHLLLEGVPGLGKTLLAKTISNCLGLQFKRVQFTPDLLPADIIGTLVYNPATGVFSTKKGPVFTQILLADEINRAPAKVQSALLEAMEEKQVTLGEESFKLPNPFIVLATQNPLEQQGTYQLPEAQLDRFFMKILLEYPSALQEEEIIIKHSGNGNLKNSNEAAVLAIADLEHCQNLVKSIYLDQNAAKYILSLIASTRNVQKGVFMHGVSPRGAINIAHAAKAVAFMHGRGYVIPDDVKEAFIPVCRHRIMLHYEALSEGLNADTALQQVLQQTSI